MPTPPAPPSPAPRRRLNLGCGRDVRPGWTNLDAMPLPGVDVVADLGRCADTPLPFADNTFDELLLSHVIEHIDATLPLLQECWRVAKPGAVAVVRVPHGASDDAWEDPTHVRPYFLGSFHYFSQPHYHRADYGYRGDWLARRHTVVIRRKGREDWTAQRVLEAERKERNLIEEIIVELEAIKPARPPEAALRTPIDLRIVWV